MILNGFEKHGKRIALILPISLFLTSLFFSFHFVFPVNASDDAVYIRSNGMIDPESAPIQRTGDIYAITHNINNSVVIEKDDIIIDGLGNIVQSNGGIGILLSNRTNVTVRNMQVMGFLVGIKLEFSRDNRLYNNTLTDNSYCGVLLQNSNHDEVASNNITNSDNGIRLEGSEGNVIQNNTATNNSFQGFYLDGSDNNMVNQNNAADNHDGFVIHDSNGNVLNGNCARSNQAFGIKLDASREVKISKNDMMNNGENGLCLDSSADCICSMCRAYDNNESGIRIASGSNNAILANTLANNGYLGIEVSSSESSSIIGNEVTSNSGGGIRLDDSPNSTVSHNTASSNKQWAGISLVNCLDSRVSENNAIENALGLHLMGCEGSTISGNVMSKNNYNFDVFWFFDTWTGNRSDFWGLNLKVDPTNVADGRPIIYLVNSSNIVLDSATKAAVIYVIDSTNVTVKDLDLNRNAYGLFFWNTNSSKIENVTVSDNLFSGVSLSYCTDVDFSSSTIANNPSRARAAYDWATVFGIEVSKCEGIRIIGNTITSTTIGVSFDGVSSSFLMDNIIANNSVGSSISIDGGIYLVRSSRNVVSGNSISCNSPNGIFVAGETTDTKVFHNNIVGNQVVDKSNIDWDNGAEGNYWNSSFTSYDADGNGVIDAPFVIDSDRSIVDNYPLNEAWVPSRILNITCASRIFEVTISSNSTTASLDFNQTGRLINFKTTGPNGTIGFYNVTIPRELLRSQDKWIISTDAETIVANVTENDTCTFLYFTLAHSTKNVHIWGNDPFDSSKPIANAGPDQTAREGTSVAFDGSASGDNIASAGELTYVWTFLDQTPQLLTGISPAYLFRSPGTYLVTLNVTDLRGNWNATSTIVTVLGIPIWSTGWFWTAVVLVPTTSGVSYLVFNSRRKQDELYEQIKRLAKRHIWNKITKEVFDEKIEKLKEYSGASKRVLIDEYVPHIMALVRAEKAIEERKIENKGKGKKSSVF